MRLCHLHLVALLALLPLAIQAAAPASTDRIIVKWREAPSQITPTSSERVRGLISRTAQKLTQGKSIGGGMSVLQLDASQTGTTLDATLKALRADPDVELAEPDRWMKAQAYTPSDTLYAGSQWYLQGTQIAAIRANAAWDITKGGTSPAASTVVVAVIDSGVRPDHPDLAGKLLPGYDFISVPAVANDGNGWDNDPSDPGDFLTDLERASDTFKNGNCTVANSTWHGTRVSGLIAASTDNGEGIAGTGFNIRVLPVRALGKCGGFESDVIAGMYWAAGLTMPAPLLQTTDLPANTHPAQIINMSLGSSGACSATYAAAVRDITAHGVLLVASTGNDGERVGNPASCEGVLAVAGIRHAGTKVGYSNLGPEVGISAPAGNCVNTAPGDPCLFSLITTTNSGAQGPGANIYTDALIRPTYGTSFSSPLVAGTAGLMKSVNPALSPAMLVARIKETARAFPTTSAGASPQPPACALPTVTPLQNQECICNTQVCGAGMLNAEAAVLAAQRPAVFATVDGLVRTGRTLTLDGSQSAAATGRTIASYLWSVESVSGGASTPVISSPTLALASVVSPSIGSYSLRLTVTDNLGAQDAAIVTVTATGSSSSSPPPTEEPSGGGGGDFSLLTLLLAAWLLATQVHRAATRRQSGDIA